MTKADEIVSPTPCLEPADKRFLWLNDKRAALIIIFAATLFTLPVLVGGLPNGDDAAMHYRRANDFIEALREGQAYPRWLPNSNYKQGNPVMLYYPPLPYYVVAAFNLVVRNPLLAVCLGCWFTLTVSGLSMYRFSRSLLPSASSLLAALTYTIAPYHLFDLYHRSALSEFWAFAWLPLVADAALRLARGGGLRAMVYFACSYALLLLTHVTIAFEMTLFLPIYFLLLTTDVRRILQAAAASLLGASMSAIFLVPLLFEVKYIRIDRALRIPFSNFFLFEHLQRLFQATLFPPPDGRRFFYLDGVNLTAVTLALIFLASLLVIWRYRHHWKNLPGLKNMILAGCVLTSLSLLLTTRLTTLLWQNIAQFAYIQFPFRWLTVSCLTVALLAGIACYLLFGEKSFPVVAGLAFAVALIFMVAISALLVWRATYDRAELEAGLVDLEVAEYRTIFLDRQKRLDEFQKPAVLGIDGDATVQALDDFGYQQSYRVNAATLSTIKLRTLYFPGWVAREDGYPVEVSPAKEGTIQVTIEPGDHILTLSFEDTPPRTTGKYLSLFGWLGLFALAWFAHRQGANPFDRL